LFALTQGINFSTLGAEDNIFGAAKSEVMTVSWAWSANIDHVSWGVHWLGCSLAYLLL
jgi:hypothetical protein